MDDASFRIQTRERMGNLHLRVDGQRVLRMKPHHGCGCAGKCKTCKCAERKKQHDAATSGKGS